MKISYNDSNSILNKSPVSSSRETEVKRRESELDKRFEQLRIQEETQKKIEAEQKRMMEQREREVREAEEREKLEALEARLRRKSNAHAESSIPNAPSSFNCGSCGRILTSVSGGSVVTCSCGAVNRSESEVQFNPMNTNETFSIKPSSSDVETITCNRCNTTLGLPSGTPSGSQGIKNCYIIINFIY